MSFHRLKDNLLSLNNLRKVTGFSILSKATKSKMKLEVFNEMPRCNVLVLAPHPDDDVFGCGGTLALHAEKQSNIKIIYLTDGSGQADEKNRKKVIETREREATKAAEIIGVRDLNFWRYGDGKIRDTKTTQKLLATLISSFKPDIIYAPSPTDPHSDHFETCKILYSTLKEVVFTGEIFSYEIWSPLYANRLIVIDSTIDKKEQAILSHASQLKDRDYFGAVMGLNQYRGSIFGAGKYAEAFLACNKELYLQLFDLYNFKV